MAKRRRNTAPAGRARTAQAAARARAVETIHDQTDAAIESMLRSGENEQALREYFGDRLYAELRSLSGNQDVRADRAAGPDVLILPGIEGSKLGTPRPIFDDVVWFDPVDAFFKRLGELSLEIVPRMHGARRLPVVLSQAQAAAAVAGVQRAVLPVRLAAGRG